MSFKAVLAMLVGAAALGAAVPAAAEIQSRTVEYEHDGVTLEGYVVWDDAIEGKRPGILVVHEWWGHDDYARKRAEMLAEMGYVAFANDMFGKGQITEHAPEAAQWVQQITANQERWVGRAAEGLKQLREHELVDDGKLAAIGYCFGGTTVTYLAYSGLDGLDGVVSFHGSLPVLSQDDAEQVKARILACHGSADPFVEPQQVLDFQRALNEAEVEFYLVSYGGARHSFTNPGANDRGIDALKYDKKADGLSWQHMKIFLDDLFD